MPLETAKMSAAMLDGRVLATGLLVGKKLQRSMLEVGPIPPYGGGTKETWSGKFQCFVLDLDMPSRDKGRTYPRTCTYRDQASNALTKC